MIEVKWLTPATQTACLCFRLCIFTENPGKAKQFEVKWLTPGLQKELRVWND